MTATRGLGEFYPGNGRRRSPETLRRYLTVCAMHTAGVVPDTALAQAAGLNRRTASSYHEILTVLRLVSDIPAWRCRCLKRLTSMPKRCVTDSGLAAWLMGVDREAPKRDTDARGRIVETHVTAQLRTEVEASSGRVHLCHLRTQGGEHEIHLIVEFGRRVAAFEVKTSSAPTPRDARHIAWLTPATTGRTVRRRRRVPHRPPPLRLGRRHRSSPHRGPLGLTHEAGGGDPYPSRIPVCQSGIGLPDAAPRRIHPAMAHFEDRKLPKYVPPPARLRRRR